MAAADIKGVRNLFLQNVVEEPKKPEPKKEVQTPEENWIRANDSWL